MTLRDVSLGQPGRLLARGASRLLAGYGFSSVDELVPARGLRVDLMALGPKSEIWIVECKSGRADFAADRKWPGYIEWCDRFFWAVDADFPIELLPDETGLIIADGYGGEILRMPPEHRLSAARRKSMLTIFARTAAVRLHRLKDPDLEMPRS